MPRFCLMVSTFRLTVRWAPFSLAPLRNIRLRVWGMKLRLGRSLSVHLLGSSMPEKLQLLRFPMMENLVWCRSCLYPECLSPVGLALNGPDIRTLLNRGGCP